MRNLKTFQVKARKPNKPRFGDFIITEVDLDKNKAVADFGTGAVTEIDISAISDVLANYSRRNKKYYVRMV